MSFSDGKAARQAYRLGSKSTPELGLIQMGDSGNSLRMGGRLTGKAEHRLWLPLRHLGARFEESQGAAIGGNAWSWTHGNPRS
jgi:hypothetical protein